MKTIPTCILAALLATAASGAVTETISQTHPLSADGTITLSNVNGPISITAWDRNEVAIEAVKKAQTAEDLARIHVKIDAQPTRLAITTDHEKSWPFGRSIRGEVKYTLRVPAGARLQKIESVNSDVTVTGLRAGVDVHTVNGGIRLLDLIGPAELHAVNGGLYAEFARLPAGVRVTFETVNGGCELVLPADAGARIDARTVNGGVHCDLPVTIEDSGRGTIRGTIGGGGAELKLRSVNGGVTIRKR
jgi:DUF4097 and DUF4098 domain-containing protein YvlB